MPPAVTGNGTICPFHALLNSTSDGLVGGRLQQAGGPLAGRDLVDFGYH
jgi:hypothetical protein